MYNFNNKLVLVTGGTGGIGGAICKHFLISEAVVIVTGTNETKLENFKKNILSENSSLNPDHIKFFKCNLSSREEMDSLVKYVNEDLGGIDILVNNAGITKDGLIMRMKNSDWDDVISVNLSAPFYLTKGIIRNMMKKEFGRIINISSVVGFSGNPGQVNYCATKAGIIGMTKALAREVASRNITVNAVAPGFIETAMTDVLTDDWKEKLLSNIPLGRMGSVDDIANAVMFLASKEAAYITGQTIHVNGGMQMV